MSHAAATMIRMPAALTTSCSQTPLVYCIRIQCAAKKSGEVICPTGKKIAACENLSTPARKNIPLRV